MGPPWGRAGKSAEAGYVGVRRLIQATVAARSLSLQSDGMADSVNGAIAIPIRADRKRRPRIGNTTGWRWPPGVCNGTALHEETGRSGDGRDAYIPAVAKALG